MTLYVIDDHPLMRDAIVMVLRRLRPAENIVELERLDKLPAGVKQHGEPKLFCLDLKLPDVTGVSGVIALKQGAGRLIRDVQDRGVLVLCDPRLTTRAYGKLFLRSLPPMPGTRELGDVRAFFAGA